MLRLYDTTRTYQVKLLDTTFYLRSTSIAERNKLAVDLSSLGTAQAGALTSFDKMLDYIVPFIEKIEGYDEPVKDTLAKLERTSDLHTIVNAIGALDGPESKNLPSSQAQNTPESAGNAEKIAVPDEDSVSTT